MGFLMPKMPKQQQMPQLPDPEGTPEEQARRRELLAQARAGGRTGSIMTDYALAATAAPTLRASLGGM